MDEENKKRVYVGFKDDQEGMIYEDVCIGFLHPKTISDNYEQMLPLIVRKEECEKIITSNKLESLLDDVKDYSRVDRLKKIFTYYVNVLRLSIEMANHLIQKDFKNNMQRIEDYLKNLDSVRDIFTQIVNRMCTLEKNEIKSCNDYIEDINIKIKGTR